MRTSQECLGWAHNLNEVNHMFGDGGHVENMSCCWRWCPMQCVAFAACRGNLRGTLGVCLHRYSDCFSKLTPALARKTSCGYFRQTIQGCKLTWYRPGDGLLWCRLQPFHQKLMTWHFWFEWQFWAPVSYLSMKFYERDLKMVYWSCLWYRWQL